MPAFGLLGKNLGHSLSKEYFDRKFREEGLPDCRYENYSFHDLDGLREFIFQATDLIGLNVTIPYKVAVIPLLDDLDPVARAINAVNVIRIRRKQGGITLEGFNTDAQAFEASLRPLITEHHRKALVLGTGGASAAVCHALSRMGIRSHLVSRKPEKSQLSYAQLDEKLIREHPLIINTTPLGMFPDVETCPPVPCEFLTRGHLVYDLVYNPAETLFMMKGREAGATVKNGLEMLRLQAELSWRIWNE